MTGSPNLKAETPNYELLQLQKQSSEVGEWGDLALMEAVGVLGTSMLLQRSENTSLSRAQNKFTQNK